MRLLPRELRGHVSMTNNCTVDIVIQTGTACTLLLGSLMAVRIQRLHPTWTLPQSLATYFKLYSHQATWTSW